MIMKKKTRILQSQQIITSVSASSSSSSCSLPLSLLKCLLLLSLSSLLLLPCVHAAHSRRRTVVRYVSEPEYDRTISTFSPDGRLLQVEYAMEASSKGSTIVCINTKDGIVLLILAPSNRYHSSINNGKVHRLNHSTFLFTSGLSGDARTLAKALRSECQQMVKINGELPTVKEIAQRAASHQHFLTRTPGRRPFGCTGLIVGVDPTSNTVQMYQSDPGGMLQDCNPIHDGSNNNDSNDIDSNDITPIITVVGRDAKQIYNMLQTKFNFQGMSTTTTITNNDDSNDGNHTNNNDNTDTLLDTASKVSEILLSELSKSIIGTGQQRSNNKQSETAVTTPTTTPVAEAWIIRPLANRRGNIKADCYPAITLKSSLKERLATTDNDKN